MKTPLFVIALNIFILFPYWQLQAQSGDSDRFDRLINILIAKQNLTLCQWEKNRGSFEGGLYYRRLAPSCANYFVSAPELTGFFIGLVGGPLDQDNIFRGCFELGWQLGFLKSHQDQWQPCSEELGNKISGAWQQTLMRCQAEGQDVHRDLGALLVKINEGKDQLSSDELSLIRFMGFALLKTSRYSQTWNWILSKHREAILNLSCQVVFMENL